MAFKILKNRREKINLFSIIFFLILFFYSIILLWSLSWAFFTSIKTNDYFLFEDNLFFPKRRGITFEHYAFLFDNQFVVRDLIRGSKFGILSMIGNSLFYVIGCSLINTTVSCFVAYLASKFKYKFSSILYWIVVVTMSIPIVGSDISTIQVLRVLGLFDTLVGNYILKFNFMGVYFLIFYASFETISNTYMEAAQMDGAPQHKIFLNVMFPLVSNMFVTIFLLNFIAYWNDYSSPLLYWPSKPTLSYGVWAVTTGAGGGNQNIYQNVPFRMTCCIFMAIPLLIIFSIFKKRIMEKISIGGIKE